MQAQKQQKSLFLALNSAQGQHIFLGQSYNRGLCLLVPLMKQLCQDTSLLVGMDAQNDLCEGLLGTGRTGVFNSCQLVIALIYVGYYQ